MVQSLHVNDRPGERNSIRICGCAYARDMCHGTSIHPASVKAVFEPGKRQKADGLTKVLAGASMKTFVSDLGLAPLTR